MARTQPRALPGGANWAGGYTSPEEIAAKVLADVRAADAKMKLTWNPERPPMAPQDRIAGKLVCVDKERNIWEVQGVNLSLPYIRIGTETRGRHYFIQNASIYKSNGDETTLEEVYRVESPEIAAAVAESFDTFIRDAAKRDDALCKICVKYRSRDHEDYLRHMVQEHPDHVMKNMVFPEAAEPEPAPEAASQATPVDPLVCCGKKFKDARGVGAHQRFGKEHKRA